MLKRWERCWIRRINALCRFQSSFFVDFMQHPSLHQFGTFWHVFHTCGCSRKRVTPSTCPTHAKLFKGYSYIVRNIAFFTSWTSWYHQVPYYDSSHKMIPWSTTSKKDTEILSDPADAHLEILPCTYFEKPLIFFMRSFINKMYIGNFFICIMTHSSKSVLRITKESSKMLFSLFF